MLNLNVLLCKLEQKDFHMQQGCSCHSLHIIQNRMFFFSFLRLQFSSAFKQGSHATVFTGTFSIEFGILDSCVKKNVLARSEETGYWVR